MGYLCTTGAVISCTMGTAPSALVASNAVTTAASSLTAATTMDFVSVTNIPTFTMCMSTSNPTVAAATSAANGVLTPQACIPVTTAWTPGSTSVMISNYPALTDSCTCTCSYGGTISITSAGQFTVQCS